MDWETNLAAIIKCTDANLEQQFRQFADLTGDLTTYSSYGPNSSAGPGSGANGLMGGFGGFGAQQSSLFDDNVDNNIGAAYFRESMASHLKHSGGGESSGGSGVPARASGMPTLFSDDFRKRQERKRSEEVPNLHSNRAAERYGNNNEDEHDDSAQCDEEFIRNNNQYTRTNNRPTRSSAHSMPYHHMYNSPTYDMAQMMEQVRLSLKLEVDARAAIAERQLSALLNLCKASTEEMDRLRVEVCANDRQIHTLDQVQAKLRQELTTQKDIGFHLQSLCGKDESWRMQAENQLLELRQLVAAIREQGNSLHATSQEKLSRAELIVQFNASIEPIKAQFHANLQHQAHQIAEITRTTSSSSLLLDALTQKVNRGVLDEISDLRNELYALKSHVTKMNTMLDGSRNTQQDQQQQVPVQLSAPVVKDPAEEADRARLKAKQRASLAEEIQASVMLTLQERMEANTKDVESNLELRLGKIVAQQQENVNQQYRKLHLVCEERSKSLTSVVETQIKTLQQHVQCELSGTVRDTSERLEQLKQQVLVTANTLVEAKATACQNRQLDLLKMVESEQKERKLSLEALQESFRASRYALEDQVHAISHETRAKVALLTENIDTKGREIEKATANATQALEKEVQRQLEGVSAALKTQVAAGNEKVDVKLRVLEDAVAQIRQTIALLSTANNESAVAVVREVKKSEAVSTVERETSAYLATMEAMLHKMQLQLQLQTQVQVQAQLQTQTQAAQVATMHPPYWVSSPYHAHHSIESSPQPPAALILAPAPILYSSSSSKVVAPPPPEPASAAEFKPQPQLERTSVSMSETKVSSAGVIETKPDDTDLSPDVGSIAAPPQLASVSAPLAPTPVTAEQQPEAPEAPSKPTDALDPLPVKSAQADPLKIQQTIAATAKGALAEAEMAKLRVENRRKQEIELRQQLQSGTSPSLSDPLTASQPAASNTSSSSFAASGGSGSQKALEPRQTPPSQPQLARAVSMSALLSGATPAPAPTASNRNRLLNDACGQDDDDTGHQSVQVPRPRSNSISGGGGAIGNMVTLAQQKVERSFQPTVTAMTGKPPPPPRPAPPMSHPPSPLAPRPAVSSTTEAKAGSPICVGSPRSSPPPSVPVSVLLGVATPPVPSFISSNPPTTVVRAATVPPALTAVISLSNSVPPVISTLLAEPKPSTATAKSPPPPPLPVTKPAPTQPPGSPLVQRPLASSSSHILCATCRLPVRTDQKHEHERSQCPKRTQECTHCHSKMLWSDVDFHERSCSALSPKVSISGGQMDTTNSTNTNDSSSNSSAIAAAGGLKKCRHCNADVASLELFDHELRCDKMLKQCPHCLRRQKMSELQDHIENCDCRLVPCPNNCGGKFLQRGIPKHLATRCPNKSTSTFGTGSSSGPGSVASSSPAQPATISSLHSPPISPHQQANSTVKATLSTPPTLAPPASSTVPTATSAAKSSVATSECKFCDEEFSAIEIDDHEDKCDWKPKRCQHCNMVIISRDLGRHEAACKMSAKSCPHCSESIPQAALAAHTARCSKRPIKCIRCCQQFPADSIVAHSTSCKFVPSTSSLSTTTSNVAEPATGSRVSLPVGAAARIPPPPPCPPNQALSAAPGGAPPTKLGSGGATGGGGPSAMPQAKPADVGEESLTERMTRRNLALSQLTKPAASVPSSSNAPPALSTNATIPGSASALEGNAAPGGLGSGPEQDDDHGIDDEEEESDEEGEEDDDEEDEAEDDQLTLAQVVAEWNVENVCLWLHEDVGVPEVVPRFQQRRCTGEMLLELTESDLINDFGVKNRLHRERILSAIDAIKTSDDFSDEEDEDEDEDDEEGDESEEDDEDASATQRASRATLGEVPFLHPRDLMRRNSLPSPQRGVSLAAVPPLPSSNSMLRRINSALSVEFPTK